MPSFPTRVCRSRPARCTALRARSSWESVCIGGLSAHPTKPTPTTAPQQQAMSSSLTPATAPKRQETVEVDLTLEASHPPDEAEQTHQGDERGAQQPPQVKTPSSFSASLLQHTLEGVDKVGEAVASFLGVTDSRFQVRLVLCVCACLSACAPTHPPHPPSHPLLNLSVQ